MNTEGLRTGVQAARTGGTKSSDPLTYAEARALESKTSGGAGGAPKSGGGGGGGGKFALSSLGSDAELKKLQAQLDKVNAMEKAWQAGEKALGPGDFAKIEGKKKLEARIAELQAKAKQ
eukprot:gb/GEZN01028739.1/.p1 GENE.gb/GEZN01028739.1/~~gb/GEZN01028739.1/.p1  ORF type:complete len:119 (-),score=30.60 gb/GEZN01028739.1/:95-451(-)